MLNNFYMVGRLVSDPKLNETNTTLTLAVSRSYKNLEGTYDTDFIPVTLMGSIAENTTEYCKEGDLVGVKGRIQSTSSSIELIADRVTFLSSQTPTQDNMSKGEI